MCRKEMDTNTKINTVTVSRNDIKTKLITLCTFRFKIAQTPNP